MVLMKSLTKAGKRFSTMLARTALISRSCRVGARREAGQPAASSEQARPPPPWPCSSQLQAHLIGDVVNGEVVQGRGVVTMEQGVQEGPAVPGDRRWGGRAAGEARSYTAPPCPQAPSPPTSGRWDSHILGLWGGSPSHTASSSVAGSPWALEQSRSAGGGGGSERGRGHQSGFPLPSLPSTSAPPPNPSPVPPLPQLTAVRVGKTQSNISHPRATQTTRSVA